MENNEESYEDILWNKYDYLQKRLGEKSMYYQSSIKYFREVLSEIERHYVNLTLINNEVNLKNPTKLDELFKLFKDSMYLILENHKKYILKVVQNIEKYLSEIKKENPIYNEFKQCYHNYQAQQKKFNQIKEKFHESALEAESKTLKKVQKKNEKKTNEQIDLSKKLKKEVQVNLKKYQSSLEEINKKREEYNTKQTILIKFFVQIEKSELNMYYSVLNDYLKLEREKTIKYFYQEKINNLVEKNNTKNIDKEVEINLKKMKSNEKKDEKISFEYKSNIDFDKCLENKDFDTYMETVGIFKRNFSKIYVDITLEKEKLKNNIRELIKKFFELDKLEKTSEISEEDEKLYFTSLKDPSTHSTFIKVVTKLRTNSKFNRKKKLIDILGESYKIILEEAEKTKNYWAAKNCLILSQTFYYENEDENNNNKNKIYAFENIKINTWLTKNEFWIGYCFWIVEEELKKFVDLFKEITLDDIKKNNNISPKLQMKLSDIIFSQLLASITNLLEITKDNMLAIEIIELFHEKYIYLSDTNMQSLFLLICSDKDEIDRLRNEYKLNKKEIDKNIIINNEELHSINNENNNEKKDENDINKDNNLNIHDDNKNNNLNNEEENKNKIIDDDNQNNNFIINNDVIQNNNNLIKDNDIEEDNNRNKIINDITDIDNIDKSKLKENQEKEKNEDKEKSENKEENNEEKNEENRDKEEKEGKKENKSEEEKKEKEEKEGKKENKSEEEKKEKEEDKKTKEENEDKKTKEENEDKKTKEEDKEENKEKEENKKNEENKENKENKENEENKENKENEENKDKENKENEENKDKENTKKENTMFQDFEVI